MYQLAVQHGTWYDHSSTGSWHFHPQLPQVCAELNWLDAIFFTLLHKCTVIIVMSCLCIFARRH